MSKLDHVDRSLLMLLQKDSTQTIKQLAATLHLTSTPVFERIKRLEKAGIIKRYRAEINAEKIGKELLIFSHVSLKEHSKEFLQNFEDQIRQLPEVADCFHVSGEHDYLLKVYVSNMKGYREFLTEKLAKIKNISNVHSSFVVESIKNDGLIDPN